jgi:hypothetical protein
VRHGRVRHNSCQRRNYLAFPVSQKQSFQLRNGDGRFGSSPAPVCITRPMAGVGHERPLDQLENQRGDGGSRSGLFRLAAVAAYSATS